MAEQTLTMITHNPSFTHSVYCINRIPGHRIQLFQKNPSLSHFPMQKPKLILFKERNGTQQKTEHTHNSDTVGFSILDEL